MAATSGGLSGINPRSADPNHDIRTDMYKCQKAFKMTYHSCTMRNERSRSESVGIKILVALHPVLLAENSVAAFVHLLQYVKLGLDV